MFKLLCFIVFFLCAIHSQAHHSMAEFDFNTIDEYQGEVIRLNWRNPHVELTLMVQDDDGTEFELEVEAQDVNTMSRRGLYPELINIGDVVRIAGHLSRRNSRLMSVTNVLLTNGTEIRFRGNPQPRWATQETETAGFGTVFGSESIEEIHANTDLEAGKEMGVFRVWMRARAGGFPSELPLTASAIEHRQNWTVADDPNTTCTVPGMPSSMRINPPHPIELLQREDGNITVHVEFFDVFRTVYMDSGIDPQAQEPSPQGFSLGHWEGETLVVNTTALNWPYFDNMAQTPLSSSVEIYERFEPTADGRQLNYLMSVTDPENFSETITGAWVLDWWPNLEMQEYDCIPPEHL